MYRHDALTVADIDELAPDGILISPGPGRPDDAGVSNDVLAHHAGRVPIFGVCLGPAVHGPGVRRRRRPCSRR